VSFTRQTVIPDLIGDPDPRFREDDKLKNESLQSDISQSDILSVIPKCIKVKVCKIKTRQKEMHL